MFRGVLGTLLAWLGLAGLADGVVEWQSWFEQGVLVHWQSVKAWVTVVLLGWLPFEVPDWVLDYLLVGTIVAGDAWSKGWVVPDDFVLEDEPLLFRAKVWWTRRSDEALSFMIGAAMWPLLLIAILTGPFRPSTRTGRVKEADFVLPDGTKPPPIVTSGPEVKRRRLRTLMLTIWRFVGFIPFLFLTSTMLYKFG